MKRRVIVVGTGLGGLTAAIRLAQHGFDVSIFEARSQPGGLASSRSIEEFEFDGGPYILLDRPGLEWVFNQLGESLDHHLDLHRIADVYEVTSGSDPPVLINDSLEATIERLEEHWPGAGDKYRRFIDAAWSTYRRLQPLQRISKVTLLSLLRTGAWRNHAYLWRSLEDVLRRTQLPQPIRDALGIWSYVAGHSMKSAPGPLAFVPALIHQIGAWYPVNGIGTIPNSLAQIAQQAGVEFNYECCVTAIKCEPRTARGIELEQGEFVPADAVLVDAHGVGTYLELIKGECQPVPRHVRRRLETLPLQSPGVCAYLAVKGETSSPYLKFHLPKNELCRLLVTPSALPIPGQESAQGWRPARLMAPMDHHASEAGGIHAQQEYLDRILAEDWWREQITEHRVLATRLPCDWGREFHLHRHSMNPVMTSRFMRAGRLAHRSPYVNRLYLAGSSTHPGQWVSFCAISGILAADRVRRDFAKC